MLMGRVMVGDRDYSFRTFGRCSGMLKSRKRAEEQKGKSCYAAVPVRGSFLQGREEAGSASWRRGGEKGHGGGLGVTGDDCSYLSSGWAVMHSKDSEGSGALCFILGLAQLLALLPQGARG